MTADPTWYPLGGQDTNTHGPNFTLPFPSYTSGHVTFGGALFEILRQFWPDDTPFTFISDEWDGMDVDVDTMMFRPLTPVTFNSFHEAQKQNAQSRIHLGIHWQFDAELGVRQGNQVADYVFDHALQPVKEDDRSAHL